MPFERAQHDLLAPAIDFAQFDQVPGEVFGNPFGGDIRTEDIGAAIDLEHTEVVDDFFWSDQPPEPHARAHRFRERCGVDRQPIRIERVDRRDLLAGESEIVIGVILENDRAEFMRQLDQLFSFFQGHRNAGWILEIGDDIDHLGRDALGPEFFQCRAQRVHVHAIVVHRDGHLVRAGVLQRPDESHPGGRFHQHRIVPVDEKIDDQPDRLRSAGGDHRIRGGGDDTLIAPEFFEQRIDQGPGAHGGAILQRPLTVRFERPHRGFGYGLRRQRLRIGEAIDERDDLGRFRRITHPRRRHILPALRIELIE